MIVKIGLKNIKVECIIGCNEEERTAVQPLLIDFEMEVNFLGNDSLESTIDYEKIAQHVIAFSKMQQFLLIESFAQELVHSLFMEFPPIERLKLVVQKPNALKACEYAYVKIQSNRQKNAT